VSIVEQSIHPPGERLDPPVHELIIGDWGQVPVVFCSEMLGVCSMFRLRIVDPSDADGDTRKTDVVADFPPKISGLLGMGSLVGQMRGIACGTLSR
jgi:hypothetical protein